MAIASSAMRVETQRLAQSAANTANAQTPDYEARRIESVTQEGGGVRGVSVETYGPRAVRVEEGGGTTQLSNTDLIEERVTQIGSLRAFQANLAVLQTSDEMLGELVRRRA